ALRIVETARLSEEFEKLFLAMDNAASSYLMIGTQNFRTDFNARFLEAEQVAENLWNTMRSEYARGLAAAAITRLREYVSALMPILDEMVLAGTPQFDQAVASVETARAMLTAAIAELDAYQAR